MSWHGCETCGVPWPRHGTVCDEAKNWIYTRSVGVVSVSSPVTEREARRLMAAGVPETVQIGGSPVYGPTK